MSLVAAVISSNVQCHGPHCSRAALRRRGHRVVVCFLRSSTEEVRKVYHSHLKVVERSCTHDKDKIVS